MQHPISFGPRSRALRTDARVHDGPVDAAGLHSVAPIPSRKSPSRKSSFVPTSQEMANLFEVAFTEASDTPDRGSAARHAHRNALMMATSRIVRVQRAALAAEAAASDGERQSPSPRAVGEVTIVEQRNEAQSDSDLEEASESQPV